MGACFLLMSDWRAHLRKGCDLQIHTTGKPLDLSTTMGVVQFIQQQEHKPVKPPTRSMVRVCLLLCCFLHSQGRKPQLLSLLPKAAGWLCPAPLYQGWAKRRWWLRWEPTKDLVSQGNPVNLCSPTRVMSTLWQSTAAQCTAALAGQGTQLRGRRWREGFCLLCHTDLLWVRLCIVQGLIQCLFLQPDYDGWEWRIRAFQEQKKPHAFQVSSGGGNFPLSFLKLLLPPRKSCICNITRVL